MSGQLFGKGIWATYEKDLPQAIELAHFVGARYIFYHVLLANPFDSAYDSQAAARVAQQVRDAGLSPLAWYSIYLRNDQSPGVEAGYAQRAIRKDGYLGVIFDAEANSLTKPAAKERAAKFARLLLDEFGLDPLTLFNCSFPNIKNHLDKRFDELMPACRGGLMPMCYGTFQQPPETVIGAWAYGHRDWAAPRWGFTPPVYPVLGAYLNEHGTQPLPPEQFAQWIDQLRAHRASFVSIFRATRFDRTLWDQFRDYQPAQPDAIYRLPGEAADPDSPAARKPVYVMADDPAHTHAVYADDGDPARRAELEAEWKRFNRPDPITGNTYTIRYRRTSHQQTTRVDYFLPPDSAPGRYRVETFVPGVHATTRRAAFKVANNFRVEGGVTRHDESPAFVDMYHVYDVWVSLGEYDLDARSHVESGRGSQVNLSIEEPPTEISFGPMRWLPVPPRPAGAPVFDPPIGTAADRVGPFATGALVANQWPIWVGQWFDYNPFLSWYSLGYHTGADLNLPGGADADKDEPIYAVADGVVTHVGNYPDDWGRIIVIEHPSAFVTLPDGRSEYRRVYSRYGHVQDTILVRAGQTVSRGQHIAYVGKPPKSSTAWHLHFDVGYTDTLRKRPQHWPNLTRKKQLEAAGVSESSPEYKQMLNDIKAEVVAHYIDPMQFIKDNHG